MVEYDPFSDELVYGDKYALYAKLREEAPVYYSEKWNCWALSRFDAVWEACQHDAFSVAKGTTLSHLLTKVQPVTAMLNSMDPPDHSKLRGRIRAFFSPRRIRELTPLIERSVRELSLPFADGDVHDFVDAFAQPLATFVGATVIGLPPEDSSYMRDLVGRFFLREEGNPGLSESGLAAMMEMNDYLAKISEARRDRPADSEDSISVLHAWEDSRGRKLSDAEVASHLSLLLVGGTDTLPKVLANLLIRLEENPDQRAELAAHPEHAVAAFNEAVRLDMPTQQMARSLSRDIHFAGRDMCEGQPVLLLYASANRDAREFDRPDAFDMHRKPPRSLGFSHGAHACIGLHVARKEGEVAINELLKHFPTYEVDRSGLERYATEFVQGYSKVPVRFS
ncbi:MAG: cytochrome P450 [Myxococcales bacterium]|nr:cytochrome P450 [Myxococcales bacterium]